MITSFYCKKCDMDQNLPSWVNGYHLDTTGKVEWYEGRCCVCETKLIRYKTEQHLDPYFQQSKKVRVMRMKLRKDLLQYGEEGFATQYPDSHKKFQKAEEKHHKKEEAYQKSKEMFYNKYRHNVVERELAKQVLEQEDRLHYG